METEGFATVPGSPATIAALVLFTLISLGLGVVANFATRKGLFLKKYFLGNRGLGPFAVALTAAVMSGGTFVGVPALIYKYGWAVALWISSYMIAGLVVLGAAGKRIGQLARKTGAITLPDLLRERYGSPALGLITSSLIMFFLTANLVAQFKAGGLIVKLVLPESASGWMASGAFAGVSDPAYVVGLLLFAGTVIAYTVYGGFLAAIWTDVFQSIIMAVGVMILLPMAWMASGGFGAATAAGVAQTDPGFASLPGALRDFLPIGLAFSFFVMWPICGIGQPSTMVRLMAYRDSKTLRYSIIWLTIYNFVIYIPIVLIFILARSVLPGLDAPDEAMPRMVMKLAPPWLAGLILAAPYGAVMSTVSAYMLIIASGLVRDLYQRFINPDVGEKTLERFSYAATLLVGVATVLLALNPPKFLQVVIIFSGAGMAASFLVPVLLGCYWRRATPVGAIAAMVGGAGTNLALYGIGIYQRSHGQFPSIGTEDKFGPYYLLGMDPCVWGLLASLACGVVVSLVTAPPDPRRISLLFDAVPADAPAPATLDLSPSPAPEALPS